MPPTEDLFRAIFEVDRDCMPEVRRLVDAAEAAGARVLRIRDVTGLDRRAD